MMVNRRRDEVQWFVRVANGNLGARLRHQLPNPFIVSAAYFGCSFKRQHSVSMFVMNEDGIYYIQV
jgi:hypothetical protein